MNGQPAKPDRVARKGLSRGTNRVWYYEVHGFVYGPTSADDIYCMILDGRLSPGVNVWVQGSYNWGPATDNVFFGSEVPDAQQVAEEDALPESNTLPPMISRNGATTYKYYGGAVGENPRATNEPPYPAASHGLTPFDETPMKQDSEATGGKAIKGCLTFVIACVVIYFLLFRGCAITPTTTTPSSTPTQAEQEATRRAGVKRTAVSQVESSMHSVSAEYSRYIEGDVTNNTGVTIDYGQVTFTLFDKNGSQVGTALDNCSSLAPGITWHFKALIFEDAAANFKFAELLGWD